MNNSLNVKGVLSFWTEKSVRWYEEASKVTHYHDQLASYIVPFLNKKDTACEIACGTGCLARKLAPFVQKYTANDIDTVATAWFENQLKAKPQENIEIVNKNWKKYLQEKQFTSIIASFFPSILYDFDLIKKTEAKQIILIVPNKSYIQSKKVANHKNPAETNKIKLKSSEDIVEFLKEHDLSCDIKSLSLEFGQPFYSIEEAKIYIQHYYKLDDPDTSEFIDKKLIQKDYGYYFPKAKDISIVKIDL